MGELAPTATPATVPNADSADRATYLNALFPQPGGWLALWMLPGKLTRFEDSVAAATEWLERNSEAPYVDIYVGVNARRACLGTGKRGKKTDILYAAGLYVDVDIAAPSLIHKTQHALPPTMRDAATLLATLGVEPTMVVDSGYGLHAYYLFDQPWVFNTPGDVANYEALLQAAQDKVIQAGAAKGWHVDNTADCTRVLRVPGTKNWKDAANPRPVELLIANGPRRSAKEWTNALLAPVATPAPKTVAAPPPAAPPAAQAEPAVPAGVLPLPEVRARLGRLKDVVKAKMATELLAGRSFADTERDRAMQQLASVVAWMAPDNDPAELARDLFGPSLGVWAAEPGATKTHAEELTKCTDKLKRAQEDARAERARIAAEDGQIKTLLGYNDQPDPLAAPSSEAYTQAELEEAARVARCTVEELSKRWVVQVGDSFYVLMQTGGRFAYSPPQRRTALDPGLYQWLERAPLTWVTQKGKKIEKKTIQDLLCDYSSTAIGAEASLRLDNSYYDPASRMFHEATCPLRPLEPVFNAEVDGWLRALGGADADKLLDWVATVTMLHIPSCALYLDGPRGAGKSLFANGHARLWNGGNPTVMARVIGDGFNADLSRCPLIFADEALPTKWHGKQTSAELREFITRNRHTLARKHLANIDIEGCVRIVLAANNDNMLAFNEDMTPEDMQAVAERFLHIQCAGAAPYLAALGTDYPQEHGWVHNDVIARHALWLRDNRPVARTGRLAVMGHQTRVHQNIATRGMRGLIVEWLAGHLNAPSPGIPKTAPIRVGGGQLAVNAKVVGDYWDQYITSDKNPPTTAAIARALKGLSTGNYPDGVRIGGVRCHDINVKMVTDWAAENGVGNTDAMQARVDAPVDTDDMATAPTATSKAPPATLHDLQTIASQATKTA